MSAIAWHYSPSLIETALEAFLPLPQPNDERACLHEAMRYAVLGGGKRLRSRLVLETAAVVSGHTLDVNIVMPAACALELIHAYSLAHDDLPAMDDADTRRGQPSCHAKFGEATAVLAGDGLLTLAFEIMAGGESDQGSAKRKVRAMAVLAKAAGEAGMVGGQAIDMDWSASGRQDISGEALLAMHSLKTGALIRCSAEIGALLGGGSDVQVQRLRDYGAHLGQAFQIQDDVLDVIGNPEQTGKAATDDANGKITAPALFGLERAQSIAQKSADAAVAALESFGPGAETLRCIARYVVERET